MIVQDDCLPCKNFAQGVEQIAQRHPDVPVILFMGSMPASTANRVTRAMKAGERYAPLLPAPFMPIPAVLWPKRKAQDFLFWAQTFPKITRADDGNAGNWVRSTKQRVLVAVPSLAQHNDHIPSVKGGREHKPGAESWRSALFLAADALEFEW